jgi:hypothetical protein
MFGFSKLANDPSCDALIIDDGMLRTQKNPYIAGDSFVKILRSSLAY